MRPTPYIGVTGVTTAQEARMLLKAGSPESTHKIMIGVLVSSKTLVNARNGRVTRYPLERNLREIFVHHPKALNILHFNTHRSKMENMNILTDLCHAHAVAGPYCHGVQLNMTWPDRDLLDLLKSSEGKIVILQCGSDALKSVDMSGRKLANKVREYGNLIDYVLIDSSRGRGIEFIPDLALECFEYLQEIPDIGFGIAGGLDVATIPRLEPLVQRFPSFSVDAETRLRNKDDRLSIAMASTYIQAAQRFFQNNQT